MATSTSEIRRYIASITHGKLFSTAQILATIPSVHSRASIDQALARMVASGILKRIAYGVFAVAEKQDEACTMLEIAKTKSIQTKKNLLCSGITRNENLNQDPSLDLRQNPDKNSGIVLFSLGKSTKFRCQGEYINIKQLSAKKMQLASSEVGAIALSLWQNGKGLTDAAEIARAIAPLSRTELEEFIALAPCMPNWLSTRAKEAIGPKWQKIERELQQKNTARVTKTAADRGH